MGNGAVPENALELEDIQDIFLKRRTHWNATCEIVPINANGTASIREEFRRRCLKMSTGEEKRYWQDRKIRKGSAEPVEFISVLKAVFKLKGAVGYVYRSQYKQGMKGIKVLLILPAEKE